MRFYDMKRDQLLREIRRALEAADPIQADADVRLLERALAKEKLPAAEVRDLLLDRIDPAVRIAFGDDASALLSSLRNHIRIPPPEGALLGHASAGSSGVTCEAYRNEKGDVDLRGNGPGATVDVRLRAGDVLVCDWSSSNDGGGRAVGSIWLEVRRGELRLVLPSASFDTDSDDPEAVHRWEADFLKVAEAAAAASGATVGSR